MKRKQYFSSNHRMFRDWFYEERCLYKSSGLPPLSLSVQSISINQHSGQRYEGSLYNDQRPDDWTWTSHDSPPDQVSFGRLRSNEKEGLMEEVA